jgi:gamma-glutamyltranspeptidase/glutathione hydrolase/leukotriene-C4 hydrolase
MDCRTRLADPAFLNGSNPIADIPTKAYARRIFANITDDTTHEASYYHPVYDVPEDHGTVS